MYNYLSRMFYTSRPYSLIYIAALGLLGCLLANPHASNSEMIHFAILGPALWMLGVLSNDFLHRHKDKISRPNRDTSEQWLLPLIIASAILVLWLASFNSWHTNLFSLLSIVFSVAYGLLKSQLIIGAFCRGLATSMLLFATAGEFGALSLLLIMAAVLFGMSDMIGNILGDYRDLEQDQLVKIKTLANQCPQNGLYLLLLLQPALMYLQLQLNLPLSHGLFYTILACTVIWGAQNHNKHLYYLLLKYLLVMLVAVYTFSSGCWLLLIPALWISHTLYRKIHKVPNRQPISLESHHHR